MDKSKVVVSLGILFIMIFSVLGIVLNYSSPAQAPLIYNDIKFTALRNSFQATVDGVSRQFLFFPQDLEYIVIPDDVKSAIDSPVWTVTYNPFDERNSSLADAQYYIESHLSDKKSIEIALTNVTTESLPQKTCESATPDQPVILLSFANETSFVLENNCVKVGAVDDFDLFRHADRVVYHVLGVMK